jgi:hypothetical protein
MKGKAKIQIQWVTRILSELPAISTPGIKSSYFHVSDPIFLTPQIPDIVRSCPQRSGMVPLAS